MFRRARASIYAPAINFTRSAIYFVNASAPKFSFNVAINRGMQRGFCNAKVLKKISPEIIKERSGVRSKPNEVNRRKVSRADLSPFHLVSLAVIDPIIVKCLNCCPIDRGSVLIHADVPSIVRRAENRPRRRRYSFSIAARWQLGRCYSYFDCLPFKGWIDG